MCSRRMIRANTSDLGSIGERSVGRTANDRGTWRGKLNQFSPNPSRNRCPARELIDSANWRIGKPDLLAEFLGGFFGHAMAGFESESLQKESFDRHPLTVVVDLIRPRADAHQFFFNVGNATPHPKDNR